MTKKNKTVQESFEEQMNRVIYMEKLYDELYEIIEKTGPSRSGLEPIRDKIAKLRDYYTGPLWMKDYDTEQEGIFPKDLKRGILAEDTIYDLLCTIADIEEK